MRVLIACEKSGRVRNAFRKLGHEAFSCDTLPSEDDSIYHIQDDVLAWLDPRGLHPDAQPWDLMIGHPPCTYLCNSGVHWLHKDESRWEKLEQGHDFFMALWNAPIEKICLENPIPHKYARLPEYTQTIQPYMFGDDASKRTCLWLKGLPKITIPDQSTWVPPRYEDGKPRWSNQTKGGQNALGPSEFRAAERSRTYEGIATALATNYG